MLLLPRSRSEDRQSMLPPWLRRLGLILDYTATGMLGLAILVLALIFCLMNIEIIARSLFGVSTLLSDEYAGYGFAFVICAGLVYAHRSDALLNVGFGLSLMSTRIRIAADTLASIVSLVTAGFAAYAGYSAWSLSWMFGSTSAFASETPLWLPQLVVPVGFGLLSLSFLEEFMRRLWSRQGSK